MHAKPGTVSINVSLSLSEIKEAQRKKRQMKERHRQEDIISNAMVVWNNEILPHWDTVYVSTAPCVLCVCVLVCSVFTWLIVCAGRERGGWESSGGRDFLPVSEDECGASPLATSSTLHQVQTHTHTLYTFILLSAHVQTQNNNELINVCVCVSTTDISSSSVP